MHHHSYTAFRPLLGLDAVVTQGCHQQLPVGAAPSAALATMVSSSHSPQKPVVMQCAAHVDHVPDAHFAVLFGASRYLRPIAVRALVVWLPRSWRPAVKVWGAVMKVCATPACCVAARSKARLLLVDTADCTAYTWLSCSLGDLFV
jgi:hypothetical protein